jgi:hypothetical protein
MIKAILLVFDPVRTWDRIVLAKKGFAAVLLLFFTPLVLLSIGGELAGIYNFGKVSEYGVTVRFTQDKLRLYGAVQLVIAFAVAFICARLIKAVAETFHSRTNYLQAFTVVAYSLSPYYLVRLLDGVPNLNPWIAFSIGIVLSMGTLYQGIPRVLMPDPPTAFGIYLISALMLAGATGIARLLGMLALFGKVKLF